MNILTIDIGGGTTKRAMMNENGEMIARYATIDSVKGHDLTWLFSSFKDLKYAYECIAISVPGFYNKKDRIITLAANLNYRNFDIDAEVRRHTNKPYFILNDANAAALGEFWQLGKDNTSEHTYKNALFYILGTGIGGGIILNGELYEGSQGYAGEFGHGRLADDTLCTCGLTGCIEPSSSARGITKFINEAAKDPNNIELHKLLRSKKFDDDKTIHLHEINDLLLHQDKPTVNAITAAIQPLVKHMSLMTYALNPEIIIIGGGPSNFGKIFLQIIADNYVKSVADWLVPTVDLVLARKQNDAQLFGAAYYAIQNYMK